MWLIVVVSMPAIFIPPRQPVPEREDVPVVAVKVKKPKRKRQKKNKTQVKMEVITESSEEQTAEEPPTPANTPEKPKKEPNRWIKHYVAYRAAHPESKSMKVTEIVKLARLSYVPTPKKSKVKPPKEVAEESTK